MSVLVRHAHSAVTIPTVLLALAGSLLTRTTDASTVFAPLALAAHRHAERGRAGKPGKSAIHGSRRSLAEARSSLSGRQQFIEPPHAGVHRHDGLLKIHVRRRSRRVGAELL